MGKLAFLFVFIALGFAAVFAADLMGYFSRIKDPVAVLQTSNGTVRRLGNGELTWDRAKGGTVFGNRDTISTGESGSAKLVFLAGGEMDLGPGAMVHLVGNPGELKLDFVQGTAKVRIAKSAKGAIAVAQKGETVAQMAPKGAKPGPGSGKPGLVSESVVTTTASAPARIQVEEVEDDAIKKIEIPKTADLIKGTVTAAKTSEKSTDPAAQKTDGNADAKSDSKSGAASGEKTAAGEGSESAPLTAAVKEKEIKNPDKSLAAEAAKSKDGEILNAKVNEMPLEPQLGFPENDAVVDLTKAEDAKLQWNHAQDATAAKPAYFEVVMRKVDEKGAQVGVVQTYKAQEPTLKIPKLSSGRYQWSVRAVTDKGNRSPAAKSRWIEVKNTAKIGKPTVLPVEVQ